MDNNGGGFLKLQEDESSRRSSRTKEELGPRGLGSSPMTRVGCGGWWGRLKVEKDEGSLRIGRLTLAPHCHFFLLAFGFCFLLAGAVLTALAYSARDKEEEERRPLSQMEETDEERVAGPLFVIIGSTLVTLGVFLALLGYRLTREGRRQQRAARFDSPSTRSPDFFNSEYFSSFPDEGRSQGGESSTRRGSFFGASFTRRSTLATIAQAVPVGFFMSDSHPSSPKPQSAGAVGVDQNGDGFQEVELSSPKKRRAVSSNDEDFVLPALSLRPSLPIPLFPFRNVGPLDPRGLVITSRSDEPFGSIASLSTGTGDIACFPSVHYALPVTVTLPEEVNEVNDTPNRSSDLPPINVSLMANNALLTTNKSGGLQYLRGSKSEERSEEEVSAVGRRGSTDA